MIVYKEESYKIVGAAFKVYNYLHATGYKLGLLLNFGCSDELEKERIVL